jgi:DNA-binding SARP family transcriptional activator
VNTPIEEPPILVEAFGGLKVFVDGAEVSAGPLRQQLLLARLLVARGRSVSLPNLVDTLWPDLPPASSANQIHRYVGDLRRAFQPSLKPRELGRVLLPSANGYRIDPASFDCDLEDFFALLDQISTATKTSDRAPLLSLYERALDVAQLPPFPEFSGAYERPDFSAVERARVDAAIGAADEFLIAGTRSSMLLILESIGSSVPLNEPLQARLIRLLVASDRRADALQLYETTRRALADQLGIDPGLELRDAHHAALTDNMAAIRAPASSDTQSVSNLPVKRAGFVERQETAEAWEDLNRAVSAASCSTAIITGMAGIGKTTLAIRWAHELAGTFSDGQLYVNLRGFDSSEEPESTDSVRDALLEALGENLAALDKDPKVRHMRYRQLLASRKLIIVLDNARDVDQVRTLVAGESKSFTIITSRNQLAGLVVREGAYSVSLSRWSEAESLRLLSGPIGTRRASKEPDAMAWIAETCAGLPLALAIMAGRAALQPNFTLHQVASQLATPGRTLDSLSAGDIDSDLRVIFDWSYQHLTFESARTFRFLSAFPGTSISGKAAASASGVLPDALRRILEELVAANMLILIGEDTYAMHDLLRAFAHELLSESEQMSAIRRFASHFISSLRNSLAVAGVSPQIGLPIPPDSPISPEHFGTVSKWSDWYKREREAIRGTLSLTWQYEMWAEYATIVSNMRLFSGQHDSNRSAMEFSINGLAAAETSGNLTYVAEASRDLGYRRILDGSPSGAYELVNRAVALFRIVDNQWGIGNSYRTLSIMAFLDGDAPAQVHYAELALESALLSGLPDILSGAYDVLAGAYNSVEQWSRTTALIADGVRATRYGTLHRVGFSADVGVALRMTGRHAQAIEIARWGIEGFDVRSPDVYGNLIIVTLCAAELGRWDEVRESAAQVHSIFSEFGDLMAEHDPELGTWMTLVDEALARAPKPDSHA